MLVRIIIMKLEMKYLQKHVMKILTIRSAGMKIIKLIIMVLVIVGLIVPSTTMKMPIQVNASGLSICDDPSVQRCEDRNNHPERYCISYGDEDEWCENVDICDYGGEITSKDQFCTGEAVRNLPEGSCPDGFHSVEEDESGLCYDNDLGCEYDTLIFNEDKTACVECKIDCDLNPDHSLCNGQERTDGIKVCDQPDHPGYKFCKDN
jgi:hypothetical protein